MWYSGENIYGELGGDDAWELVPNPSSVAAQHLSADGHGHYHWRMASIEVGIRIDMTAGVSFFGLEAVNKQLAAGLRIRELRPGGLITSKVGEEGGNVQLALSGCQIVVVFEGD